MHTAVFAVRRHGTSIPPRNERKHILTKRETKLIANMPNHLVYRQTVSFGTVGDDEQPVEYHPALQLFRSRNLTIQLSRVTHESHVFARILL